MKTNTYNALRLFAGLLTIIIVVAQQYVPEKRIKVVPNSSYPQSLYGPSNADPEHQVRWINEDEHHWVCTFSPKDDYSCGYSVSMSIDNVKGLNLEAYEGINIKLNYKGDASRLRIYMRNYNPAYARGNPILSAKFISTIIRTEDLRRGAFIKLSEFSVGEWWIKEYDIPREYAAPEFSNIVSMGFDFISNGAHEVNVESIDLTGSWFLRESLYLGIIIFWMALIIWEGIHRFYIVYRDSRMAQQKIAKLETDYDLLELEKSEYEALSTTDVLTGVFNRAGVQKIATNVFQQNHEDRHLGILLFDIDNFKNVNDHHGHDCGDKILKELAQLISQNVRQRDAFGRWGGEEFVLLCVKISEEQIQALAEKLRKLVDEHQFTPQQASHITVSVGATLITQNDSFDAALKRADLALYDAKHQGRNRAVFKSA